MTRPGIIVIALVGVAALAALVAVVLLQLLSPDRYRPQIETGLTEAVGMEVRLDRAVHFIWIPGLQVSLQAVSIHNGGLEFASARTATIGVRYLPLLRGVVSIETLALDDVSVSIERNENGRYNFQNDRSDTPGTSDLDLTRVSLSKIALRFKGPAPWQAFQATACSIEGRVLSRPTRNIAFHGEIRCGEVTTEALTLSDVEFSANAEGGVITLEPVKLRLLDANGTGRITADFTGAMPQVAVQFSLPHFPIEAFFRTLPGQQIIVGPMDFSTDLSMQGSSFAELTKTMAGPVSLRGSNLSVEGIDLDEEFSRLQSGRNFNLVDVGAFFLAGPVGLAVTRGYQMGKLLQGSGGTSEIRSLVSDWQVEHGVMRARDVAMTTAQNRIALQGALDFVNREFDEVVVALVDSNGCIKVAQEVQGTFDNPLVEAPGVIELLASPALELLEQAGDLLTSGNCEVFYSGSVVTPN